MHATETDTEPCTYCGTDGATRISPDPFYDECRFCDEECERQMAAFDDETFRLALIKAEADGECVYTGEPIYACICDRCTRAPIDA